MFNIYYGPDQQQLADRLLSELDNRLPGNVLAPEVFVVQNHGMGQWLSIHMARERGIAANLKFEFPSERIWSLIRTMDRGIPEHLPSDRQPMTWTLMQLLQDEELLDDFERVRYYLKDDDESRRLLRTWKLSAKIADVFDQYLIYRPELLLGWEQGTLRHPGDSTEQWQAALWNRLISYWKEHYDGDRLHRARLQKDLLSHIRDGKMHERALPERVTVFGVSALPPVFIRIFAELSAFVDVNFYQLCPDGARDDRRAFDNPLLHSLGTRGRDFMQLLADAGAESGQRIGWNYVAPQKMTDNSLWIRVKSNLRRDTSNSKKSDLSPDGTIQVHSCHSPMREVEVLYNRLLDLLDRDPELNPDDILIMTPDIATYAPMVEAVFGTPDDGQPSIPYSIADRDTKDQPPAVEAFLSILELCDSRFKITDVLDLLDTEPVRRKFSLTADELNRLERWVRDNNIRWGIDKEFKERMDLAVSQHFTWKAGLDRMLLGYAMMPEDDQLYDGIFPYEEIEGSEIAGLAGRFSRVLQCLFKAGRRVGQPRTHREWTEELERIHEQFLPDDSDYYREMSAIRNAIQQLTTEAELGGYAGSVPFSIVRLRLREELESQTLGGGHIGRGVTFSSLNPMRSIPFKVIGMMGMNEGAFPGTKIPIEFDLMHLYPSPGDPSQSEEDRYLFWENLLSARSVLYFSYVGQSNRQDTDYPPSVVLKEFLDYLQDQYGISEKNLVNRHRLQAFNPQYFKDEAHVSYSRTQLSISRELADASRNADPFFKTTLPEADEKWKKLTINDLISFFQHPAKFIMQNRLGIHFRDKDVLTEDREPFVLDKLDEYKVGRQLLDRFLKEQSLANYQRVMRSLDMLPEGWSGEQAYNRKVKEVQTFGENIRQRLDEQQLPDRKVDLKIGEFRLAGSLSDIYQSARMDYRFGKARPKDKTGWWIRHLLFQQVKPESHSGRSRLFSWHKSSFNEYRLAPVAGAESLLAELLKHYHEGLRTPLPLYSESSFAYAENIIQKGRKREYAISKAVKKWESSSYRGRYYPGEEDDPYFNLAAGGRPPFDDPGFAELSLLFWKPYFEALDRGEG